MTTLTGVIAKVEYLGHLQSNPHNFLLIFLWYYSSSGIFDQFQDQPLGVPREHHLGQVLVEVLQGRSKSKLKRLGDIFQIKMFNVNLLKKKLYYMNFIITHKKNVFYSFMTRIHILDERFLQVNLISYLTVLFFWIQVSIIQTI